MIGYLKGKVLSKSAETSSLVLLVDNTGYEITACKPLWDTTPEGADAEIWIHTHVREDALQLFGFGSELDKKVFRILISASGVGPKVGMALVGDLGVKTVVNAIARKQSDDLAEATGVGKKLAQKIVLELGSKIEKLEWLETVTTLNTAVRVAPPSAATAEERLREELSSALQNLSFPPNSVRTVVDRLFAQAGGPANFETAFKQCLQELSGRVTKKESPQPGGLNG